MALIVDRKPAEEGFFMPGEFEAHAGCIMVWPYRPGSWPHGAVAARKAFVRVIAAIAKSEKVYVGVRTGDIRSAEEMLQNISNVELFLCETDDAWARDIAPTFLTNREHQVRCVNWEFNAWGGIYNGLYADWEKDNQFAEFFAEKYGYTCYDAAPFVLEGGAIHSDGEGTVLVTEACLLSPGRNPGLTREQITQKLKDYLGAKQVLWLPRGIYLDETDEHVDNVCAFLRPGEVVLAWTDDVNDPQYALSHATQQFLEQAVDAKGRKLKIHHLPIPQHPVCVRTEELEGYIFEDGEDVREAGERLAASYVNFYLSNKAVVMPAFGGENEASDRQAADILRDLCTEREIIPVYARDILLGGGNIHCITQQIPAGRKDSLSVHERYMEQ